MRITKIIFAGSAGLALTAALCAGLWMTAAPGRVQTGSAPAFTGSEEREESSATEGLAYEQVEWKDEYAVAGMGECSETDIVVCDQCGDCPVTAVAVEAFRGCTSLRTVLLPDSVTEIGEGAFYGCTSLAAVEMPAVTDIGARAFYGCTSLSSVTLPDSLYSVGDYAFYGCDSLETVVIPESVGVIGAYAFYNCASLTDIFCEAESMPEGWDFAWKNYFTTTVHWKDEWHYVGGVPTPKPIDPEQTTNFTRFSRQND